MCRSDGTAARRGAASRRPQPRFRRPGPQVGREHRWRRRRPSQVHQMDVEPVLRTAQRSQGVATWGQLLAEHPRRRIEAAVDAGLCWSGSDAAGCRCRAPPTRCARRWCTAGVVSHAVSSAAVVPGDAARSGHHATSPCRRAPPRGRCPAAPCCTGPTWSARGAGSGDEPAAHGGRLRPHDAVPRGADRRRLRPAAPRRRRRTSSVHAAAAVRGPGAVAARRVADAADDRAMSPLESGLRGDRPRARPDAASGSRCRSAPPG